MGKSKKQQLAGELGKEMTAVVITHPAAEVVVENGDEGYEHVLDLLEDRKKEIHNLKLNLNQARRDLHRTRRRMEELDNENRRLMELSRRWEKTYWAMLSKWLSKASVRKVTTMIGFYKPEDRQELLGAMLRYVLTGEKKRLSKVVSGWHFDIFIEMVDEDAYTVPTHSLLKQLWEKIGLLQGIEN